MDKETYIKTRVDDQINWMNGKSGWNQKMYKRIKIAEIIAAALIPMLAGYQTDVTNTRSTLGIIIGALGVVIVILSSIRQLNKYQENWITYRTTIESLKREKFLFETGAMPYNDELSFQKFVMSIESLLSKENESWKAVWVRQEEIVVPAPLNKGDETNDITTEKKPAAESNNNTAAKDTPAEEAIVDEPAAKDTPTDDIVSNDVTDSPDDAPTEDGKSK